MSAADVSARLLRIALGLVPHASAAEVAFAVATVAVLLHHGTAPLAAFGWLLAVALLAAVRWRFCRRARAPREGSPVDALGRMAVFAGASGLAWAAGLVALVPPDPTGAAFHVGFATAASVAFTATFGVAGRPLPWALVPVALAQVAVVAVAPVAMPVVVLAASAAVHVFAVLIVRRARRAIGASLTLLSQAERSVRAHESAAAELHRSREQFRLALDAIDAGVSDTNLISGERFFSARYAELLRYDDRERFLADHRFSDALHPDDRERVLAARAAHIEAGQPFRERCRLRTADGAYVWVQLRGESVRGSDGRATRLVVSVVDISAQREAELRIADSERRYRALVETSPSLIWTCDAKGFLTFVSERACRMMYGFEPAQVLGRHVAEFNAPQFRRFGFLRRFGPVMRGRAVHDVPAVHRAAGGATLHVIVSVLPTLDADGRTVAMLGVCSDITALKRREAELGVALRNQQAIFDAAGEGMVTLRDGRVESANRAVAKLLGVTRGYLIGQQATELLAQVSDWNAIQRASREAAARGEASIHELLLRARDGRSVWCQVTAREVEPGALILVLADITLLKRREELAWHQANHDELTGLPNRRSLIEHARRLLSVVVRQRRQAAVLVLDLDGFKVVNDVFGHASGDALLRRVALRLSSVLREYDVLARTGGDEFVVLLPEIDQSAAVGAVAQKLVAAAAEDLEGGGRVLPIRASVGVAIFPDDGADFDTLLARADAAMYEAKAGGKNQFRMGPSGARNREAQG